MEIKNNVLEMTEDVKNEMAKILWTPEEMAKPNINMEDINLEIKESKTEENEIDVTEVAKEVKENKDETKKESKPKKPRNVSKPGNANWFEQIPESDRLQPGDIICLTVDGLNKFGEFIKYGKRQGIYWVNMRKKDSLELMKKEWSVKDFECDIVFHNGELNPKYSVDDKGIYRIK